MKKLINEGYAFSFKVSIVGTNKGDSLTYWGFACPLWWPGPYWDMETIMEKGVFGSGKGLGIFQIVLGQCDNLEDLETVLLRRCKEKFPEPFKLNHGGDARMAWPELYKHCKKQGE